MGKTNITNERKSSSQPKLNATIEEWSKLQTDFYTKLTTETLAYLRRLQAVNAPSTPGTIVIPRGVKALKFIGHPQKRVQVDITLTNKQAAYVSAIPMLTPFASPSGVVWYPEPVYSSNLILIAPGLNHDFGFSLMIPSDLPSGMYRGSLRFEGFLENAIPLAFDIRVKGSSNLRRTTKRRQSKATAKKSK